MTITVYWACLENEWMLAQPPESVASRFYQNYSVNHAEPQSLINYCPAFNGNLKNLFALKSIYDYNFRIENGYLKTESHNQQFFNEHITVRSLEKKFFSFNNRYIFFTEEPSLDVTFYEYPFLEDNNITERCLIPAGKFNIGKWFRNSEFSFFLKTRYNEFRIEKEEVYSYMRIHTDEQINFVQFRSNQKLSDYNKDGFQLTNSPLKSLENYYKSFRNKKLILKEIKENLL
jgi:hypothetical protein